MVVHLQERKRRQKILEQNAGLRAMSAFRSSAGLRLREKSSLFVPIQEARRIIFLPFRLSFYLWHVPTDAEEMKETDDQLEKNGTSEIARLRDSSMGHFMKHLSQLTPISARAMSTRTGQVTENRKREKLKISFRS
ncbi:uncharacterized protein [Venturia canescens]|uniref:uncharacterized protein n=1 Tax=Venturia canescens TaxID=32260 RepID=UPI001C9C9C99|nr:uncharacterized protein LOC122406667 [Venturia canescens]